MDGSGAGRWINDVSPIDGECIDGRIRAVLEGTEAAHRRAAALLRANGKDGLARRIDGSAAWVRFDLDEPLVAQRLYGTAAKLQRIRGLQLLADRTLEELLSLARADGGNLQLADPASGELRIIAQRGFDAEFLEYFAVVSDGRSACGRVLSTPLVDRAGRLVGIFSTHYRRPYDPPDRDKRIIKRYADLVARILASRLSAAPPERPDLAELGTTACAAD